MRMLKEKEENAFNEELKLKSVPKGSQNEAKLLLNHLKLQLLIFANDLFCYL